MMNFQPLLAKGNRYRTLGGGGSRVTLALLLWVLWWAKKKHTEEQNHKLIYKYVHIYTYK